MLGLYAQSFAAFHVLIFNSQVAWHGVNSGIKGALLHAMLVPQLSTMLPQCLGALNHAAGQTR